MAVYGLKPVKNGPNQQMVTLRMRSNVTITRGDPIFLENDGASENVADLATSSEPIFGVAQETLTNASGGTTNIQVFVPDADTVFEIDNDNVGDTFATTADRGLGNYFSLTGATGAVLVDTSTGGTVATNKQFICVKQNPDASDTSLGWFKIAKAMFQG